MPDASLRQRLMARQWYKRVPCDPAPDQLALTLREANVHKVAAKQLDTFDRYAEKHAEHRSQLVRGLCSVAAIGLGLSPAIPGTYKACHTDDRIDCALKIGAIIGGALAIGVGAWALMELFYHPVKMHRQRDKMSAELERDQHRKAGQVAIPDFLNHYQKMSATERRELKAHLHEHVKVPKALAGIEAASNIAVA